MTRLPLLPISFLLATVSVGALAYQRTRPVESEAVVQLDRVAKAVAATSSAKSFTFTYSATITTAGESLTMSGSGAYDLVRRVGAMKMHFDSPELGPAAAQATMDVVFDRSNGVVEYMHMPLLDGKLPAGKSWVKIDLGALTQQSGIDLSKLSQGDRGDPAKFFAYLQRAADPTVVGHEAVGGVETTHYRARIDLRRLAEAETDPATRETFRQVIEKSGVSSYPVHVWIDGAGYLRRMRLAMPLSAEGETAMMTMSEELSNFGAPVNVSLPPAASVVDVTALAGS